MRIKQHGHAGIVFVLILPVLWGITAVSLDGSRGIQTNVRLSEAVDSSVIAVSAKEINVLAEDKALVESYVRSYIADATTVEPYVEINNCGGDESCIQYDVAADVKIDTWFPGSDTIQGFDETMLISSDAKAQKGSMITSDPIDVVMAIDMSLSMQYDFTAQPGKERRDAIYDTVDRLVSLLGKLNDASEEKSTLAFVPWGTGYYDESCLKHEPVYNELGYNVERHTWNHVATIERLWEKKDRSHCIKQSWLQMPRNNGILYPTDSFDHFPSKVRAMSFNQATQVSHGMIKGAQLLKEGVNKKKALIVVTDGADGQFTDLTTSINDYGLCEEISNGLKINELGEEVELTYIIIGIDAHLYDTSWMSACVGDENVFTAETGQEFLDAVLSFTEMSDSDIGYFVK